MRDRIYLKTTEVLEILRCSPTILRRRMKETPEAWSKPWFNFGGSEKRPHFQWKADEIDAWWRSINGDKGARHGGADG